MKIVLAIISFTVILCICSCNDESSKTEQSKQIIDTPTDTIKSTTQNKEYKLPNDEFRDKVISHLTNQKDILMLDTLTAILDKKNLSFCQFIKRQFEIDDSCYAVAKKQYPDPFMQEKFAKCHEKALAIAQPKYLKSIGVSEHWADLASGAYLFDETIKKFCGNY